MYIKIDNLLNISDEKIKQLIIDTFEEKFKYMDKANYLRWINRTVTIDRIKKLIIEIMTDEEMEKEPNTAGLYILNKNKLKLRDGFANLRVSDHETNHFLSDGYYLKFRRFPTFIDEGITEYLTQEIVKSNDMAYKDNVIFVRLLYSIFGDEIIKCYLTGVTSEFYNKLDCLLKDKNGNSPNFDLIMASLMKHFYDQDYSLRIIGEQELSLEESKEQFANCIKNILLNSIKNEMIRFNFYEKNGNININKLTEVLNERKDLIYKFDSGISKYFDSSLISQAFKEALNSSYLKDFYSEEELSSIFDGTNISSTRLNELLNGVDNKLFYALKNKLEQYSNNQELFDISQFLYDFFKIMALANSDSKMKLYESLLRDEIFKRIKGEIDLEQLKSIISSHSDFLYRVSKLGLENEMNFSSSKIVKIPEVDLFIEKTDGNLYVIEYNKKTKKFLKNRMPAPEYFPYNKDYSKLKKNNPTLSYYRINLSTISKSVVVMIDKDYNNIYSKNQKLIPKDGYKTIIDSFIADEVINVDYQKYIVYMNDGEDKSNLTFIGNAVQFVNTNSRFIDFNSICDTLENIKKLYNNDILENAKEKIIKKCLASAYPNMEIPKDILSEIYFKMNVQGELANYDNINIKLIKLWRELLLNTKSTLLVVRDENSKRYFENKKNRESIDKYRKEAKELLESDFDNIFLEKNKDYDYVKNEINEMTFGIDGAFFKNYDKDLHCYPVFSKVDYQFLISLIKEKLNEISEDNNKNLFLNCMLDNLRKYYGGTSGKIDIGLNGIINDILSYLATSVNSESEEIIEELNKKTETLLEKFSSSKSIILNRILLSDIDFEDYGDVGLRELFNKVIETQYDNNFTQEDKKRIIDVLVVLINKDIDKYKKNEDRAILLDMRKAKLEKNKIITSQSHKL